MSDNRDLEEREVRASVPPSVPEAEEGTTVNGSGNDNSIVSHDDTNTSTDVAEKDGQTNAEVALTVENEATQRQAEEQGVAGAEDTDALALAMGLGIDDEEGFDPATLANLAALSRIINDDDDEDGDQENNDGQAEGDGLMGDEHEREPLTREQVQEFVHSLSTAREREKEKEREKDKDKGQEQESERDEDQEGEKDKDKDKDKDEDGQMKEGDGDIGTGEDEEEKQDDDDEYDEGRSDTGGGKGKRRRNRTTLSCTECHRRCDRNIPCSRCIKRGVPGMCRMEHPILPQRKRRKVIEEVDINYELGLRVQALESLLRSGSMMDAESASAAARETIMHATRAANAGSQDANNALAQLTQSAAAGTGIGGMTQDAQSSLLLDVLQQLTAASMGRSLNTNGNGGTGNRRGLELWSSIPTAPQETVVAIASSFDSDDNTNKINLSLPGFREDNGKLFVPPTVRYVEKNLRNDTLLSRETLPIEGYAPFLDQGIRFAYGADSQPYRHRRISSIQAVSLTGALRLASTFLSRISSSPSTRAVYIPSPTADEDTTALQDAGLEIRSFRYLNPRTGSVDWESLREDLHVAPPKSVVLLQVSGSMPTGAELTTNQWRLLATLLQEKELIPLVMMSFQGLSTGDTNRDAQALRFMVHEGLPVVLVQSFDAMMGLYADGPAIVSVVTQNVEDKERVDSQLRAVARGMWLHPSPWGAFVAHQILSDPKIHPAWLAEIKAMSDRLRSVREKLYDLLANKLKTPGSWLHIKRAGGMYCTALIPPSQSEALTAKRHIHLLPEGCFNLGCLNASKIDILARAIDYVVREGIKEAEIAAAERLAIELALAAEKEEEMRQEAELQALREAAEAQAARDEDTLLMEASIANAIEAQRLAEEEEKKREERRKIESERDKERREREEIARQAELILATIS